MGAVDLSRVWTVGDRLMTDVYLANRIGCKSILLQPLEQSNIAKHGLAVTLLRQLENILLNLKANKGDAQ